MPVLMHVANTTDVTGFRQYTLSVKENATGVVKIYKTADGTEVRALAPHAGPVSGVTYLPNGANLDS